MTNRAADAARLRQQLARTPNDRVAWHNLAAAEGDLGRAVEAEAAARRALRLGITAPETSLVLARALQAQGKLDEAERAFEEVLRQRPAYVDAHRDYAQLVWMRTGQVGLALRRLGAVLAAAPHDAGLHLIHSIVLEFAGDPTAALAAAEHGLKSAPGDGPLLRQTAHLCGETGQAARALNFAQAAGKSGADARAQIALCDALLAAGDIGAAEAIIAKLMPAQPLNQYVIALQATAWRLRGDARYAELYDYAALVSVQSLERPPEWTTMDSFLADVAAELDALHRFVAHPLQQSVRGGGQLTLQEHHMTRPLIRALFTSIHAAVHRHLAAVGAGSDPMRARNTGRGAFTGAWSVRLSSGGLHVDHVHPQGWLSSACYIALPPTIGSGADAGPGRPPDRAGWLRFGRPGIPVVPALGADHFVKPEPGVLALFPAYMWHGVEPFVSDRPRLTVAFDVLPA